MKTFLAEQEHSDSTYKKKMQLEKWIPNNLYVPFYSLLSK